MSDKQSTNFFMNNQQTFVKIKKGSAVVFFMFILMSATEGSYPYAMIPIVYMSSVISEIEIQNNIHQNKRNRLQNFINQIKTISLIAIIKKIGIGFDVVLGISNLIKFNKGTILNRGSPTYILL